MIDSLSVATKGEITGTDYVDNNSLINAVDGLLPILKQVAAQQLLSQSIVFISKKLLNSGEFIDVQKITFAELVRRLTDLNVNVDTINKVNVSKLKLSAYQLGLNDLDELIFNIKQLAIKDANEVNYNLNNFSYKDVEELTANINSYDLTIVNQSNSNISKISVNRILKQTTGGFELKMDDTEDNQELNVKTFRFNRLD